jgi:hypothetical protein
VGGMTIGTLFTLFVVPSVYVLIARDHRGEKLGDGRDAEDSGMAPGGAAMQPGE